MTGEQQARFAARSRILADVDVSCLACRLFLWLDDTAKGEPKFAVRQQLMTMAMGRGRSRRQIVDALAELRDAGYLDYRRTIHGNSYEFGWASHVRKTAQPDVRKTAPRMCGKPHNLLYEQESTRTPLPPSGNECGNCGGVGVIQRVVRGQASNARCEPCNGTGQAQPERRSA